MRFSHSTVCHTLPVSCQEATWKLEHRAFWGDIQWKHQPDILCEYWTWGTVASEFHGKYCHSQNGNPGMPWTHGLATHWPEACFK